MRTRLLTAVRAVLADPALSGALDAVRLAAVLLLAKAPAAAAGVRIRARDLAAWLGCSESYVDHVVLPALRSASVVRSRPTKDADGQVDGLELTLMSLERGRAEGPGDPLSLSQPELATLLRLAEAVFGPGWPAKDDKPETPPGLLAGRRGKGAGTERLALFLLVLQTRPNGRVVMAPGSVTAGFGRAAATVARQLGSSLPVAQRVVQSLEAAKLLQIDGVLNRERLVVPAVALAHRPTRDAAPEPSRSGLPDATSPSVPIGCVHCDHCVAAGSDRVGELSGEGFVQESFDDVLRAAEGDVSGALRDHLDLGGANAMPESLGAAGVDGLVADVDGGGDGALLHTTHPQLVANVGSSDGYLDGFSGSAVSGCGPLPDRASAGESQPEVDDPSTAADSGAVAECPLRGEKPASSVRGAGSSLLPAWLVGQTAVAVPRDLTLALAPVGFLWARLGKPSTQRWMASRVRSELERIRDLVGADRAERVLAARFEVRLGELFGRPVADPVAWILKRALPQRVGCWSVLCDNEVRMDTGLPCASCATITGDRRDLRARIRAEVVAEAVGLSPGEQRAEVDRRLNLAVQHQIVMAELRRERGLAEKGLRMEVVERRRAEIAAEHTAWAGQPCADCGIPDAGGLCLACTADRGVARVLRQAVDVAVAMRADFTDLQAVRDLSAQIEADTLATADAAAAGEVLRDPAVVTFARLSALRKILAERTQRALHRLEAGSIAQRAARQVRWAAERRTHLYSTDAERQAAVASEEHKARAGAARDLLDGLLADVARSQPTDPGPPEPRWSAVLSGLAARPLPGDTIHVASGELVGVG
ncbi:hypothetical protein ACODT5_02410 [Streptomyces sp. 5.8]|uniref:hypothetical protein n=1 Tax=Streptomyces sp. 5.8 TaxID=3406571 RepID=UPI003BB7B68C